MKKRFGFKPPLIIGLFSLVLILVFGTLFAIRAVQNRQRRQEPVFERVLVPAGTEATAAETSPLSTTEAAAAATEAAEVEASPEDATEKHRDAVYYFNEDVYLSRRLAGKQTDPAAGEYTEATHQTAATAAVFAPTGRYRAAAVVSQFRKEPSVYSAAHRELWAGEQVFEISSDGSWSMVRDADGVEGYVSSALLTAVAVQAAAPAAPVTAAPTAAPTQAPTQAPTAAWQAVNRSRYIVNGVVNVRQSDSVYSALLTSLPVGSVVTEIAVGPEWSRIRLADGSTGYVVTTLLSAAPAPTSPPATLPASPPTTAPTSPPTSAPTSPPTTAPIEFAWADKIQYVTSAMVNVRAAASTASNVLISLPLGSSVHVTGVGSEWSRVSLSSGQTGYVYNSLLSDMKPVIPTSPPTSAPTSPPVAPPANSLNFMSPGSAASAVHNLSQISSYIRPNGDKHYSYFTDNGNNTITVDGLTLPYYSVASYGMTHYDGLAVSVAMGEYPPKNRSTASGIPAQRGLIAMKLPVYGGLPFGTVVFVENYGLAVLADRGTLSSKTQVDLCYNAGESSSVRFYGWAMQRMYIISIP